MDMTNMSDTLIAMDFDDEKKLLEYLVYDAKVDMDLARSLILCSQLLATMRTRCVHAVQGEKLL